jgi:hypothetical protein
LPGSNPCFQPSTSMSTSIGLQAQDYSLQIKVNSNSFYLNIGLIFFLFRLFQNL